MNYFLYISGLDVLLNSPLLPEKIQSNLEEKPSRFSKVTRTDGINLKDKLLQSGAWRENKIETLNKNTV